MAESIYGSESKTGQTKRNQLDIMRTELEAERSSFLSHWKDISEFMLPRRSRFYTSDVNKGDRRNQKIIDSTATLSLRTLRSGMMSGITSPARPWFRLTTNDQSLSEYKPVQEWLYQVTNIMSNSFLRSNLYNSLPIIYGDMGGFGTACMLIEEDMDDVIRTYPFPIGSYMIANDEKLKVNVFFRDFRLTVRQIVMKFGTMKENGQPDWSIFSDYIKNLWDRGNYEAWVDVCHVIRPNPKYNPNKILSKYKKFESCYFERGWSGNNAGSNYMTNEPEKYLREAGYDLFPIVAPRWEITGEDVYGTDCPGMTALGDVKQLQTEQKRKAQAIEKMVNPPMTGPTSLKNARASILPGDITFSDEREGQKGFRPAHEIDFRIRELMEDIQDVRNNIRRAFFEDLFLMLAQSDRREITAREIDERHEEKLLALGPVLEQLNQDALDPIIDISFAMHLKQGRLPPPPPELQGVELKIEYISTMAQAQKLVGIGGLERFANFAATMIKLSGDPAVADKVNFDQMLDEHGMATGIPPTIIRSDEEVAAMRQQRQQAAQAQQQMEMIEQGSKAAKNLGSIKTDEPNAATDMVRAMAAGQQQ